MIKVFILCLSLTACSWTDALDFIIPSKDGGINTELVVGDKNQSVVTEVGSETNNQQAESIVNNITDEAPIWLILFGMIGWVLPSPQSMWTSWRNRNVRK